MNVLPGLPLESWKNDIKRGEHSAQPIVFALIMIDIHYIRLKLALNIFNPLATDNNYVISVSQIANESKKISLQKLFSIRLIML